MRLVDARRQWRVLCTYGALLVAWSMSGCGTSEAPRFESTEPRQADLVIRGGTVIDGSGAPARTGWVVEVIDGRIVRVGPDEGRGGRREIDATGMHVTPGFIDPHTHADADLLDPERSVNEPWLRQGVTTVFIGNDGRGTPQVAERSAALRALGTGTHVALLVGHGALRTEVVGEEDRPASEQEIAAMQALFAEALDAGAFGLSSGLFYAPGSYADTDELVALAEVAAARGRIHESHIRDEADYDAGLLAAIDELIEISRRSGVAGHVAHIKALGPSVWGRSGEVIEHIEAARAEGLEITADQYPWLASGTRLSNALLPRAMMSGGQEAFLERVRARPVTADLRAAVEANLVRRGSSSALLITGESAWQGKRLDEVHEEAGGDLVELVLEIVAAGDPSVASFMMDPADVERFMTMGWVVTGSDGTTGHPRKFGSFPEKFQRYVVERPVLSVEEFVAGSTGRTAEIFDLCDRGRLEAGRIADIAIWDPESFRSRASYERPRELAGGVEHLLLRGESAISEGRLVDGARGEVLTPVSCE